MQKQRDEWFKGFLKRIDQKFDAMDNRFDSIDNQFDITQRQIDRCFDKLEQKFDNINEGCANIIEGLAYCEVKQEFKNLGFEIDPQIRQHFYDKEHKISPNTTDVEIDIFYVNPNIIGEATIKIIDLKKIENFVKKINFIEQMYGGEHFNRFLFAFNIDEAIKPKLEALLQKNGIKLILFPKKG